MLKPGVEGAAGVEKSPEPVSPEVDGVENSKLPPQGLIEVKFYGIRNFI